MIPRSYGVYGNPAPAAAPARHPVPPGTQSDAPAGRPASAPGKPAPGSFAGALARAIQAPVHLSRHAQERLSAAGRSLRPDELQRVAGAMQSAAARGSRQALLLLPDLALVVHPPSGTVITAVTDSRRQGGLFTDIDCTAIL